MVNHPPDCVCEECLRILEDTSEGESESLARSLGVHLGTALWHLRHGFPRFRLHRRRRIAPGELAQSLHEVFVQEQSNDDGPTPFEIPQALVSPFRAKVTLYREAVILMVLLSESRKRSAYREVLSAYEELVLGPKATPAGLEKLEALKVAMADLGRLIHPQGQKMELTWSSEWLKDIGHIDYNPARTTVFALSWMRRYCTIVELIREFKVRS